MRLWRARVRFPERDLAPPAVASVYGLATPVPRSGGTASLGQSGGRGGGAIKNCRLAGQEAFGDLESNISIYNPVAEQALEILDQLRELRPGR
jgi:hypothetical protein